MTKVGLKDTLALLAKGYSKKEIDALAAIDEENNQELPDNPDEKNEVQEPDPGQAQEKDPEPDYKKLYEDLLKENQEKDEQIKEIQKDNRESNSLPDLEKQREEETNSLNEAFKSFY